MDRRWWGRLGGFFCRHPLCTHAGDDENRLHWMRKKRLLIPTLAAAVDMSCRKKKSRQWTSGSIVIKCRLNEASIWRGPEINGAAWANCGQWGQTQTDTHRQAIEDGALLNAQARAKKVKAPEWHLLGLSKHPAQATRVMSFCVFSENASC